MKKKRTKTREKLSFSTIGEAVDYVIITQLLSCKICMVLQDSCMTGILIYHLARFALSCKILARLASVCKKLTRKPCFVRNFQDKCKIFISSKLGLIHWAIGFTKMLQNFNCILFLRFSRTPFQPDFEYLDLDQGSHSVTSSSTVSAKCSL